MALSTQATESLLQAVDIIASSKIGEVSYDQTIICTVVDNSEAEKRGFYTVTDGKVRFKAYTNVTDYKVGDQIRVTVPNGNFNEKKYIDGPYAKDDDSSSITYVSSLDSFLSMAELIDPNENVTGELIANNLDVQNQNGIPIKNIILSEGYYTDLQQNGIYDALGISADFKCFLGEYQIKSGNYGLRLDVKIKLNTLDNYVIKSFYLDSSEMFGNPYNFVAPSTQEKMFNITSLGTATEITIYFYQNNNFTYYNTDTRAVENLPVKDYNIKVENIRISFGTNIANVEDNTLKIYSMSNNGFNYKNPTDQSNTKNIGLLWYNKNNLNQYLGFTDGIVDFTKDNQVNPYDEIQYLKDTKRNARLVSQMGKPDVPRDAAGLELAALVDEAFAAVEELKVLINKDLINTLKNYQAKFETLFPEGLVIIDDNYLNKIQNGGTESYIEKLDSDLAEKKEYLIAKLAHVAKLQRVQRAEDFWNGDEAGPTDTQPELSALINSKLTSLQEIHTGTLAKFKTLIEKEEFKNFKSSYDAFEKAVGDILLLISTKIAEIDAKAYITDKEVDDTTGEETTEKFTLEEALNWYDENPNAYTGIYTAKGEEDYSNRYCIYWYRYVPGYIAPNEEYDFAGNEWERIIPKTNVDGTLIQISSKDDDFAQIPQNLGLPEGYFEKDGVYYWNKKPDKNKGTLNIYLNPKMHQEKFKAVLFYNHEKYESNPIVFTNLDDINSIYNDVTSALSIEHIDQSTDSYQDVYSPNNFLYNRGNAKKKRGVKAVYRGVLGTTKDVLIDANNPAYIYWYIPRENTMLSVDYDYLTKPESDGGAGFTSNYVPTYRFKKDVLKRLWLWNNYLKKQYSNDRSKWLQFFQDKPSKSNNKAPSLYYFDEWLSFINPTMQIAETTTFEDLDLSNVFRGFKKVGNYISLTEDFSMKELERTGDNLSQWGGKWLQFPFKMALPKLNEEKTDINPSDKEEVDLIEEVETQDEHSREGYGYFYKKIEDIKDTEFYYQIKNYFVKNEGNNQIICFVEKDSESFEASLNITFGNQGNLGADYNFIIDPANKQSAVMPNKSLQVNISLFDYDNNQIPIYEYDMSEMNNGDAYLTTSTNSTSYIQWIGDEDAYQFSLKEDVNNIVIGGEISRNSNAENIGAILQLTASFKDDSKSDSDPTESSGKDYKKRKLSNITAFYSVPYATANFYIEGATSVIYDNNGGNPDYYKNPYKIFYVDPTEKETGDNVQGTEVTNVSWQIIYCRYANGQFSQLDPIKDKNTVQFCENYLPVLNNKNVLSPCATYLDDGDSETTYYPFIQCLNSSGQVIWSQPIIVRKNRYAANMANAFDSSLSINLDSGCIISSLMNAFRRGGSTGDTLQGFLVGDLQKNDSSKALGFYGFNNGQMSFLFDVNGSATLGKNGAAQIKFDELARKYEIVSSSYNEGAQGLKIDLEDGVIDIYGTQKGDSRKSVAPGSGFFKNKSTQFEYTNLNSDSEKKTAHIYINAASSNSGGYQTPSGSGGTGTGLPPWWKVFTSFGGNAQKSRAVNSNNNDNTSIDTSNALFKIEVPSDANNSSYQSLLLISDTNSLIQSNNYSTGQYTWPQEENNDDQVAGDGMRIDLNYGAIDAYKLKISSNNILINSSGDSDPLFVVRDSNKKNLMYVTDNKKDGENKIDEAFFLRSSDYVPNSSGMEIDVMHGNITSYNFSLKGVAGDGDYKGAFILITSGNEETENKPTIQFSIPTGEDKNLDLLKISPDAFVLNSPNYVEGETGLSLDLYNGNIISYDFTLRGESNSGSIYLASNHRENEDQQGVPMIQLQQKNENSSINLLTVSPNEFIFMSPNYGGDEIDKDDSGLKLDIIQGYMGARSSGKELLSIDNDSFILTSPTFNDGTGINLDIFNGALEVKNNGVSLMSISNTKDNQSFMLTSANFLNENGKKDKGMQIDVLNGSIEVRHNIDRTLLYINPEPSTDYPNGAFFLKSQDWQDNQNTGMQIDLMSSMIIMRQTGSNNQLILNASDTLYPLQIGTKTNEDSPLRFKVGWDGTIYVGDRSLNIGTDDNGNLQINGNTSANSFTASGDITVGGQLSVTGNAILSSNIELGGNLIMGGNLAVSGYLISPQVKGSLTVFDDDNKSKFAVTSGGAISGTSLELTGAISGTSLDVSGAIQGASLNVDSGVISGGAISGTSLSVRGAISGTSLDVSGAIQGTSLSIGSGTISGGTISGTTLDVGSGAISGGVIQGTSLNMSGGAIFGKSVTINGDNSLASITFGLGNVKNSLAFSPVQVELKTIEIDGTKCQVYVKSANNSSSGMYLYCGAY